MKYDKATRGDIRTLDAIIKREFPYTSYTPEKIAEKVISDRFFVMKSHQKNIFTGFVEMEFFDHQARLNGLYVEEAWRGQKVGLKLVKKAMHECKRRRVHSIFLLVREDNEAAKHLYSKLKFEFEKMHDKELGGSKVEVWSIKIA